jgi:predicted DNA-binding transcriptional regulator YafY
MDYSKRMNRLLRIITLVQSERGWTPRRLAEEMGVTERTIYRDLDTLKDAGVPLFFDQATEQYRIVKDFFLPPVALTIDESLALAALCEHVGEREQIPFLKPAWRALSKIEARLPASVREELATRTRDFAIQTAASMPGEGYADVFDAVQSALATRRKMECRYEAVSSTVNDPAGDRDGDDGDGNGGNGGDDDIFEFCPYALFFSVRAWYAIGQRSDRDDLRCLKLSRFTKATVTDRPYMVPDGFNLDGYLGNAWRMMRGEDVEVEIWFNPRFAQTVTDTQWHRTQEFVWHEDDSCTISFTVAGLDEIAWWVLSMGPNCVVRKPAELVDRVRTLARETAGIYDDKR